MDVWAGMPYIVFMDQARNNLAHVRTQLIERGVHCEFSSLEQHHHLGRCERSGGVWKEIWRRVCFDQQLLTEGDVEVGAAETNRAKKGDDETWRFCSGAVGARKGRAHPRQSDRPT